MIQSIETLAAEIVTKIRSSPSDSPINQSDMVRTMILDAIGHLIVTAAEEGRKQGREETMKWVSAVAKETTERLHNIDLTKWSG